MISRPLLAGGVSFGTKFLPAAIGTVTIAGLLAFGLVTASRVRAQSPTADRQTTAEGKMAFDAASVKVNKTGNIGGARENLRSPGGYVSATNFALEFLIQKAYYPYQPEGSSNMQFLIFGMADWMETKRFDIEARAEGNPTVAQKQAMLQSLLEDRFKLVMHHETRQLPIYAFVLAKAGKMGPQLIPHADNANCVDPEATTPPASSNATALLPICGNLSIQNRSGSLFFVARGVTLEWFAANLSGMVGRLVVDRTGLSGTFDLTVGYTPEVGQPGFHPRTDASSNPSAQPSIFTALQEQLGLKLDSQTGPVDVLVIDHAEEPSPN